MRPIQFGAEARLDIKASEARKIPKPYSNLDPVQDTFDEFERRVENIQHKIARHPGRDGFEYTVDQQYAAVVIDHEGARTEIKTNYNGKRVIPMPPGFKNTDRGWKAYFHDVLTELRRYEATLLSKEQRLEKDLNGSKRLISQIAPGLTSGNFEVLGDPDQLERQWAKERVEYSPKPVVMDVRIGDRVFTVTRRYSDRASIWVYQFKPKGSPGETLPDETLELEFDAEASPGFSLIPEMKYRDEHGVELDLDAHHRKLLEDSRRDVDWRLRPEEKQEMRESQAVMDRQATAIWDEQFAPMADAMRNLDAGTRKKHLYHDKGDK